MIQQINEELEINNTCPHKVCEYKSPNSALFYLSIPVRAITKLIEAILRLLLIAATIAKKYKLEMTFRYTVVVDKKTDVWKDDLIAVVMSKVIAFYQKYKINIIYNVVKKDGIKFAKLKEPLYSIGPYINIFLIDKFSDCPNCITKGEWDGLQIKVFYAKNLKESLWVHIAHEIGHSLDLKHGGETKYNLMLDDGPYSDSVEKVVLTCSQVLKIKS